METKALKPTFSCKLQSRMAVQSAPLWLMKPTLPGRAIPLAKVALRPVMRAHDAQAVRADHAHVPATCLFQDLPLQLGACRASLLEACGNHDGPAHPALGALPDHIRHGRRRCDDNREIDRGGHVCHAGVGFDAQHVVRLGLTGKMVPPKGVRMRLVRTVRPTLPDCSLAPMTATVSGVKIASRG